MVFQRLVLRAIVLSEAPGFDLTLWKCALDSKEQYDNDRESDLGRNVTKTFSLPS